MRPTTAGHEFGEVIGALREQPGGGELLRMGRAREDLALVGGAVRDLLLGRTPRELDVVVAADAAGFARELAADLAPGAAQAPSATLHERFGTAVVEWETGRVDIAERRAETYPAPGALPQVRPGTTEEDLRRRDFTVNAIAVPLGGPLLGEIISAEHALEDLRAGRLRVIHAHSFTDDPTRLLRLARYRARLGFECEELTAELARAALVSGALDTVSRARIGAEVRLALGETEAIAALSAIGELGVLSALEPRLRLREPLARRALALLPADGRPEELLMASLLLELSQSSVEDPGTAMFEFLDGLEFTAAERERITRSALAAPSLTREMELAERPSELHETLCAQTLEAIALAAAMDRGGPAGRASEAAREWFERLRHVRLQITGEDLLAAGIEPGPQLGRLLALTLARRLDGELPDGRRAELDAALRARV